MLSQRERMSKGIIDLQRNEPFFALLTMRLRISEMPDNIRAMLQAKGLSATAGVTPDGRLLFAPEFISKLSGDEMQGLLCHEVLHVALLHFLRTGSRNHTVANIAQDCVVNMAVVLANIRLPDGEGRSIVYEKYDDCCLVPFGNGGKMIKILKVSDKSWEQIYDELMQHYKDKKMQPPPDFQQGFDVHLRDLDDEHLTDAEREEIANEWTGAIVDAATYAKKIGKLPQGMERFIKGLLKPTVSWREELTRYIKPMLSPVDFSYRKPHRVSQIVGVYLPHVEKEHLNVEVLVDTSGSISDDILREFLTEVVAIAEAHQHVKMFVTFCDAEVSGRFEVENGDIPKLFAQKCKGGGGTDLEEGLDDIELRGGGDEEVSVVIVLTDGENNFNHTKNPYRFDIVWVVKPQGNTNIPYGRVIPMDKGE